MAVDRGSANRDASAGSGERGSRLAAYHIRKAAFPGDLAAILDIWREYVSSPSVSLVYQQNEKEFAGLPRKYRPPEGCILLGEIEGQLTGCVAYRKASAQVCEMKRLYVRPTARGTGLGRALVAAVIDEARNAGYAEMRLDVLAEFETAQKLYASFGFKDAAAITQNPTPGARFMGLKLD